MTQYHPWEIYNHGQTPIPEGRVQVQLRRATRPDAEKSEPCFMSERLRRGANVIAFRRVKEPVRGALVFWRVESGDWFRGATYNPTHKMTMETEDGLPIPDTYIGKNTGAEIKIEEVG